MDNLRILGIQVEEFYQKIFANSSIAISILSGNDFKVIAANQPQLALWQKSRNEIINQPLFKIFPECKSQEFERILRNVWDDGAFFKGEEIPAQLMRNNTFDLGWFNISYDPVLDENGKTAFIIVTSMEVTDAVLARKKSDEHEKMMIELTSAMPLLVWIANDTGTISFYNKKITDYSNTWQKGSPVYHWLGLVHPDDLQPTIDQWKKAVSENTMYAIEHRLKMKDGAYRWHISRATRQKNSNNETFFWYGTATDIHDNKVLAEQKAAISSRLKLFEKVIVNINDVVMITEAQSVEAPGPVITYVNQAFSRLTGYTFDEAVGQSPRFLQGPGTDRKSLDLLKSSLKKWESAKVELVNYRKDGSEFDVEFEVVPVADENGWYTHWISIQRDITERKRVAAALLKREQFNRAVMESSPDCMQIIDRDGRIQFINKNGMLLLGANDTETILKSSWLELWTVNHRAIAEQALHEVRVSRSAAFCGIGKTFTGRIRHWDVRLSMIDSLDGQDQIIAVLRDVTEQKAAEQALQKSHEQLAGSIKLASIAIAEIDYTTNRAKLSPEAAVMYGFPETQLSVTRHELHDTFHPSYRATMEVLIAKSLNPSGTGLIEVEHPICMPDKSVKWIKVNKQVYFNRTSLPHKPTYSILAVKDITAQKLSQELLLSSEAKYRGLFEKMDQGFCIIEMIFDNKGHPLDYLFVECNAVFTRQTGLQDAVGKTAKQLVPNLEEKWFLLYGNVAITGKPAHFSEGSEEMGRWFEVYAYKLDKTNHKQVAILFTDTTTQRTYEAALQASERKFRNAFTYSAISMAICNSQGKFLHVNDAYLSLLGYTMEELSQLDLREITHPEDRALFTVMITKLLDKTNNSAGFIDEKRCLRKDGKVVWTQISVSITRDEASNPLSIIILAEDVTEKKSTIELLKQNELTFRTLANALPQLVWMADKTGRHLFNSAQWVTYSGFDAALEERLWDTLLHQDDREKFLKTWVTAVNLGQPFKSDIRLRNSQGLYKWHMAEGLPIKDGFGEILQWVGAFSDIQEQKESEFKKDEFIGIASHEMRTPLTSVKGYIQILQQSLKDTAHQVYAARAASSIGKLENLITELLDASKIQGGKLSLNTEEINFNDLVNSCIENLQPSYSQHKIIKLGQISRKMRGDKNRLEQVLINLITNAIKYSPFATKVEVSLIEQDNKLQVAVKDFGLGIKPEHLERIFERYFRVPENEIAFQGLGIGLYITRNIIGQHGGEIWVESELGKGSRFYFVLPL